MMTLPLTRGRKSSQRLLITDTPSPVGERLPSVHHQVVLIASIWTTARVSNNMKAAPRKNMRPLGRRPRRVPWIEA
jgi:hypothetical protein